MHNIYLALMVCLVFLLSHKPIWSQGEESQDSSQSEKVRAKDDQQSQIQTYKMTLWYLFSR